MSNLAFLSRFITDEVYLIREEPLSKEQPTVENAQTKTVSPSPSTEENKVEEKEPVYLKPLPTEGNNLKHCLVFFESAQPSLEPDKKAFLLKVLSSVKRNLDDVLLVNAHEASNEQIEAVLTEYSHKQLLTFGTERLHMLSKSSAYTVVEQNKASYLKADDLAKIEQTVELKKALWGGLQKMFL